MALGYVTEHRPTHRDIVIHTADDVAPANDDDDEEEEDDNEYDNSVLVRGNKERDDNEIVRIHTDSGSDSGDRDSVSENSSFIMDDDDDNGDDDEGDARDSSSNNQGDNQH